MGSTELDTENSGFYVKGLLNKPGMMAEILSKATRNGLCARVYGLFTLDCHPGYPAVGLPLPEFLTV